VTAREEILQAVRAARPAAIPLPDVQAATRDFATPPGDLAERFVETAAAAGTRVVEATRAEVASVVAAEYPDARRIVSAAAGIPGTVAEETDIAALAEIDLFVCKGVLGVAENGAVWIPASRAAHRAAAFLAPHVVVLLDRAAVVAHLHEAYRRLDVAAEPFALFVAGPSKTADIEQSLVIGAHGPRSLTLILLDS
jgi:L-lactate dehydrogenase complex protein LldG